MSSSEGRDLICCRWLPAVLALALASAVPARAEGIQCPASIQEAPNVSAPGADWTLVAPSGARPLERAAVFLGPPAEHAALVPDATRKLRGKEIVRWRLAPEEAGGYWIGCSYVGTTAMLFQELDRAMTECAIGYDLLPTGKRLRLGSIACR